MNGGTTRDQEIDEIDACLLVIIVNAYKVYRAQRAYQPHCSYQQNARTAISKTDLWLSKHLD